MIEARAVIANSRGLHARPAAKLAKLAGRYDSDITIYKGRRKANAKSIASLLTLAAAEGSNLKIVATGKDEKRAAEALLKLIAAGFRDDDVVNNPQTPEVLPDGARRKKHPMYEVSGLGVTDAVVVGRAHIHHAGATEVSHYRLDKQQVEGEVRRYDKAAEAVRRDFAELRQQAEALPSAMEITPFIDLYEMLLNDAEFAKKPQALIRRRQINAEWALMERVNVVNDSFRRIRDSYLRERGRDIEHVMKRLLAAMGAGTRTHKLAATGEGRILLSADLDPADVIRAHHAGYVGFITESGGGASHTAILARSMKIPALVGARGVLKCVRHDAPLLLDAAGDIVVVNPDAELLDKHKTWRERKKPSARRRRKKTGDGTTTLDGERVLLHSNIEMPDEVDRGIDAGADGIGLFRTEFLFMNRDELPGEDEQFEIYREVSARMAPLPVVIRTLDLGGDKMPSPTADRPANPALGVRAIRYCLAMPEMFLTQLRALLRASAEHGNLRVLLPMLSHPSELSRTMTLLASAREQLRLSRGLDCPPPPLGGMIEVPSSVFIMPALAKSLQFFSIGTNDLIQYTLAIDRNDEMLAPLYDPLHPAVLRLLAMTVENAGRVNCPVVLCGEIAGDASLTRLMLALGLRQLSMNASSVEEVRERIRITDCGELRAAARHILRAPDPDTARAVLEEMNRD